MTGWHPSIDSGLPEPGQPQIVSRGQWAASRFFSATQDIRGGTTWSVQRDADTVIVHLGGRIDSLETELEGCGTLCAPPMPGEIWIVPAGQRYASRAKGGRVHYAELHLDPQVAKAVLSREGFPTSVRSRAGCLDPFLHRAALRLEELTQKSDDLSRMAAESLSQAAMLDFYGRYCQTGPAAAGGRNIRFCARERDAIGQFIAANLGKPLGLEVLAAQVNMTVHELLIAFRAEFHTTPAQYVVEQRLRSARSLLLATRKTVAEIAYATGFSSHAHLSSVFRARVGTTPNAFRLEHRGHSRIAT